MSRFYRSRESCVIVHFCHCTLYNPQVAEVSQENEISHLNAQHLHLMKGLFVYEGDLVVHMVEHSEDIMVPRPESRIDDTGDESSWSWSAVCKGWNCSQLPPLRARKRAFSTTFCFSNEWVVCTILVCMVHCTTPFMQLLYRSTTSPLLRWSWTVVMWAGVQCWP